MSNAVLKRLNGDTTWLLQLPFAKEGSGSRNYNLLIDPWLSDSEQVDFHPAFSSQSRTIASSYPTLSSLSQALALEALEQAGRQRSDSTHEQERQYPHRSECSGKIDGILISHPFTDHAHPQSLLELPDRTEEDEPIPLFCTEQSRTAVMSLFQKAGLDQRRYRVVLLPAATRDEQSFARESSDGLPAGISILHLPAAEGLFSAWGSLHSGIAVVWKVGSSAEAFASVVYSPHGTLQTSIPPWLQRGVHRVLITSFDEQRLPLLEYITGPVALGFETAVLPCYASLKKLVPDDGGHYAPTMIVRTHDEKKRAKGLVGQVIRRKEMGVEAAQQLLRRRVGQVAGSVHDVEAGSRIEVV